MKNLSKIFFYLFIAAGLIVLFSLILDFEQGLYLQLLAIPALGLYFYFSIHQDLKLRKLLKYVLPAMLFSWMGDIFMIMPSQTEVNFLLGITIFIPANMAYILLYNKASDKLNGRSILRRKPGVTFPFMFCSIIIYYHIYPQLGEIAIPAAVFWIMLTLMALSALYRYSKTNTPSFVMVIIGALLFIASSSVLFINRYYTPVPYSSFITFFSYLLAQGLIIEGIIRHKDLLQPKRVPYSPKTEINIKLEKI